MPGILGSMAAKRDSRGKAGRPARSPDRFTSSSSTGRMPKRSAGPRIRGPWQWISRPPGALILFRTVVPYFTIPSASLAGKSSPRLFSSCLLSAQTCIVTTSKTVCNGCRAGCLTLFPCPKVPSFMHTFPGSRRFFPASGRRDNRHPRASPGAVAPADALDPLVGKTTVGRDLPLIDAEPALQVPDDGSAPRRCTEDYGKWRSRVCLKISA